MNKKDNRNIYTSLNFMVLGVLLGILGSMVASILLKYLSIGPLADFFIVAGFFILLILFLRLIEKTKK